MYHAFEIIILYVYNTRPKNAPKGVIVLCFHLNIRCDSKEQKEAKSCRLGLCKSQNKKA